MPGFDYSKYMLPVLAFIARHWPFRHGTGWLVERPSRLVKTWPINKRFRLKDGRILQGDLNDRLFRYLYLYGTYETAMSSALSRLVRPGDVVVDVGANIGVITALLGHLVGPSGRVYSFEPVPPSYEKLCQTIALNHLEPVVHAYPIAVGDGKQEQLTIYVPRKHSHACSSSRVDDPTEANPYLCQMITLDQASFIQGIPVLIKVDVEGAELSVLQGAEQIYRSVHPPIWVMEINHRTAKLFDFVPEDLAIWLVQRNYARFYWSNDWTFRLYKPGNVLPQDGTLYAIPEWAIAEGRLLAL